MKETKYQIKLFLILLLVMMIFPSGMLILLGMDGSSGLFTVTLMFAPALAAVVTLLVQKESLKTLGFKKAKPKYFVYGYIIPLLACMIIYIPTWITGLGTVGEVVWLETLPNALLGPFIMILLVLGEEIGWRGFLFTKLLTIMDFHKAVWVTGGIWALFHFPIIFFAGYNSSQPVWYAVIMFSFGILGGAYISGYLRVVSGSLLPAALLHSSHNVFFQMVFDRATVEGPWTSLWTTEFGAGVALCYLLIAMVLIKKMKRKII